MMAQGVGSKCVYDCGLRSMGIRGYMLGLVGRIEGDGPFNSRLNSGGAERT